jgi:hypothetical protein
MADEQSNPITNPNLVAAMRAMKATNNVNDKVQFFAELKRAKLILPVKIEPEPIDNVIAKDASITYFSMKTGSGEDLLAGFTDFEELAKWNKGYCKEVLAFEFEKIRDLIVRTGDTYDGVVIDPMGENVYVKKAAILNVDNQSQHDLVVKPEKVMTQNNMGLRPAAIKPVELLNDVAEYMKTQDNIKAAYCMQTTRAGEDEPTIVLVVDFTGNELKKTFDGIANAAKKAIEGGKAIGMMPANDKIAAKAVVGVEPFYKK